MTRAEIEAHLAEARAALHQLMTGSATVSVSYSDRSVTYGRREVGELRAYIRDLEAQLGGRGRPFGVRF